MTEHAPAASRAQDPADFVVVTGLSGAGRSEAAKVLEDLGYFVIDNLPASLIGRVADLAAGNREGPRIALVIDARGSTLGGDVNAVLGGIALLRAREGRVRVLFLEASQEAIVRRYEATRRRHPIGAEGVVAAIATERELLRDLRETADLVIDTTDLNVHQLRAELLTTFVEDAAGGMLVTVMSFGFKYGLPLDADVVLDVRFLPNPHWVEELRPKTGLDEEVRDYVVAQPATGEFLERLQDLLRVGLPGYVREGKQYLTVAIGCTGGRHRSVVLTEALAAWVRQLGDPGVRVRVAHRDIGRAG